VLGGAAGVAVVVLEVVHTPGGEQLGVLLLVPEAAGQSLAGAGPGVFVDAESSMLTYW